MLAIRLQRVGRKGHATYRLAVQEAQRSPSSGRIVAYVGSYDPHTKASSVQVELAQKYLDNGAQPSPRVVKLLASAGVKLPKWVVKAVNKTKVTRDVTKLRKNRPAEEAPKEVTEVAEEEVVETPVEVEEAPADETETPAEEIVAEEPEAIVEVEEVK